MPTSRAVDDDVEQLVDRHAAPATIAEPSRTLLVMRPEPVALGPQRAHPVHDRLVDGHSPSRACSGVKSTSTPCSLPSSRDLDDPVGDGQLAALDLVPRVVGVLLVGADEQLEVAAAGRGQRAPRRRREHAGEVEQDRGDRSRARSSAVAVRDRHAAVLAEGLGRDARARAGSAAACTRRVDQAGDAIDERGVEARPRPARRA